MLNTLLVMWWQCGVRRCPGMVCTAWLGPARPATGMHCSDARRFRCRPHSFLANGPQRGSYARRVELPASGGTTTDKRIRLAQLYTMLERLFMRGVGCVAVWSGGKYTLRDTPPVLAQQCAQVVYGTSTSNPTRIPDQSYLLFSHISQCAACWY